MAAGPTRKYPLELQMGFHDQIAVEVLLLLKCGSPLTPLVSRFFIFCC